jgi:hypothetical protein
MQTDKTIRVRHEDTPERFVIVIHALTAIGGSILSVAIHIVGTPDLKTRGIAALWARVKEIDGRLAGHPGQHIRPEVQS